jgi:hypothetical protein
MGVIQMGEKPIKNLQGARVSVSRPLEGGTPTMVRIELLTEQGLVPLMGNDLFVFRIFVSDDRLREQEDSARINAFAKQGEGTLEVRREGKVYSVLGGLVAFALGLGLAFARVGSRSGTGSKTA